MLEPYPFQLTDIEQCKQGNMIVASECGLGKTLVAVEAIKYFRTQYQRPILIVAPKRTHLQWVECLVQQGVLSASNIDEDLLMLGAAGYGFPEDGFVAPHLIVMTHYESFNYIGEKLAAVPWLVAVFDEAHRVKNRKTKRWVWAKEIKALRKIALTGTPMEKLPTDMWTLLHWINPDQWRSFWGFSARYVKTVRSWDGKYALPVGGQNLDELAEEIRPVFIRRTKKEVAPDLPEKIMSRVHVEMDKDQEDVYMQIKHGAAKDIEVTVDAPNWSGENITTMLIVNTLAKIIRLQQVAVDPDLLGFTCSSAKFEWLDDYINDNPEEPMVIFSRFRDVVIKLSEKYSGDLIIGGAKSGRPMVGEDFCLGRKRLLFGTTAAMGEGLNLQRARTAIFLDQEWSQTKMQQAIDRVHRIDIKEPKNIIYLAAYHTVDNLVLAALDRKWTETQLVMEFLKDKEVP